ncbi:MAG: beta-ketoacyl synthase chain length factor [Usitatibacter sp.]
MNLVARIEGIGLVGPGLVDWNAAREVLAGRQPFEHKPVVFPAPEMLPAAERRRAGKCVRLALAVGIEAAGHSGRAARELVSIFTSSSGDGETMHAICEALASEDREISPTRFHNSVHNAPAGYWGIATGAMHPADSIAAFNASFAAGLLEAMVRLAQQPAQPVLLVAYDAPYPEPLQGARPLSDSFACALVLCAGPDAKGPMIRVDVSSQPANSLEDAGLEALRAGVPAARALPLLALLARESAGPATIEYLGGKSLTVDVRP